VKSRGGGQLSFHRANLRAKFSAWVRPAAPEKPWRVAWPSGRQQGFPQRPRPISFLSARGRKRSATTAAQFVRKDDRGARHNSACQTLTPLMARGVKNHSLLAKTCGSKRVCPGPSDRRPNTYSAVLCPLWNRSLGEVRGTGAPLGEGPRKPGGMWIGGG